MPKKKKDEKKKGSLLAILFWLVILLVLYSMSFIGNDPEKRAEVRRRGFPETGDLAHPEMPGNRLSNGHH